MDTTQLIRQSAHAWEIAPFGKMRGPAIIYVRRTLIRDEEAPGAYEDVNALTDAADHAKLAYKATRLEPLICIKE